MPSLFCFGDSWAAGAELKSNEKPFAELLAADFLYDIRNYGQNNMSLGLIVRQLSITLPSISKDDIVLVVIPPDSRWYTEWSTMDYGTFSELYISATDDWFIYHHQLFIFTICELLNKVGCRYLLMHNYGEFPLRDDSYCFSRFHADKFLSRASLTSLLNNLSGYKDPIEIETEPNPSENLFYGPYFEGNQTHPNQRGHIRIAEFIKAKLGL